MASLNSILTIERGSPEPSDGIGDMEPTHDGEHERTYLVQCWVHPSSGKDLIDKNRILEEMKTFLGHVFTNDESLEEGMKQFEKQMDGLVLHPFFMKSMHAVNDPEDEFMAKIRTTHPEAKLASCQEIPNSK